MVQHNHRGIQPKPYQWATHPSVPSTAKEGGHFFHASYGVLVRAAADSFSWKVEDLHGTTLQRKQPAWSTIDHSGFQQRGFTFLTSKSLVNAWMVKTLASVSQEKEDQEIVDGETDEKKNAEDEGLRRGTVDEYAEDLRK